MQHNGTPCPAATKSLRRRRLGLIIGSGHAVAYAGTRARRRCLTAAALLDSLTHHGHGAAGREWGRASAGCYAAVDASAWRPAPAGCAARRSRWVKAAERWGREQAAAVRIDRCGPWCRSSRLTAHRPGRRRGEGGRSRAVGGEQRGLGRVRPSGCGGTRSGRTSWARRSGAVRPSSAPTARWRPRPASSPGARPRTSSS